MQFCELRYGKTMILNGEFKELENSWNKVPIHETCFNSRCVATIHLFSFIFPTISQATTPNISAEFNATVAQEKDMNELETPCADAERREAVTAQSMAKAISTIKTAATNSNKIKKLFFLLIPKIPPTLLNLPLSNT